jgi:HAE1 family hydrophobic/amphiphilic exporter-1
LTLLILIGAVIMTVAVGKATGFKIEADSDRGMRREQLEIDFEFTDNMNYVATREAVRTVEASILDHKEELGIESVYSYYRDNQAGTYLFFEDTPLSEERVRLIRRELREILPPVPGARLRLGGEEEAGIGAERLEVTLFGEDSDLLADYAREAKRRLALIPELEDVSSDAEGGKEEVAVRVRREVARRSGISPREIAEILALTFRGVEMPPFRAGEREVPVGVILDRGDRRNIEDLSSLPVAIEEGREVTLGQIADLEIQKGPETIRRLHQRTAITVFGNYEGEDFGALRGRVAEVMDGIAMPVGYWWSFGQEIQESDEQKTEMLVNILLAIICVYLVMASLFESLLHPLVIMVTIPFAFLGVVWTMMVTRTPMNIMALIGVVILIGVVVNNGIILIDHVNGFRRRGLSRGDAILAGGRERMRPILMTASTTVLGLIPLALGHASVGDAQYYPMARAVMGGLIVSAGLTLVVLPTLYVLSEKVAWAIGRVLAGAVGAVRRRM